MTEATMCPSREVSDTMKLMQSPDFKPTTRCGCFTLPTAPILFDLFERATLENSIPLQPSASSRRRSAATLGSSNPPTTERAARPDDMQFDLNSSFEGGLSMSSNAPQCNNGASAQPAAAVTQDGTAVPTNVPGDVDLFGQLTLLENAEWYVPKSPYIGFDI